MTTGGLHVFHLSLLLERKCGIHNELQSGVFKKNLNLDDIGSRSRALIERRVKQENTNGHERKSEARVL